jgi:hypothetical protein
MKRREFQPDPERENLRRHAESFLRWMGLDLEHFQSRNWADTATVPSQASEAIIDDMTGEAPDISATEPLHEEGG